MTDAAPAGRVARTVAWLVVHLRFLIVPLWVAAAALATIHLPGAREFEGQQVSDLVPEDAPAIRAEILSVRLFDFPLLTRIAMVQRDPDGLDPDAQGRVFGRALDIATGAEPRAEGIAGAFPVTNTLELFPGSREDSTTAITYLFFLPDTSLTDQTEIARRYARAVVNEPGDALVGVTGAIPARIEQSDLILRYLPFVELGTIALIALIVGLYFRSVIAPLVTLGTSAVAYLISLRVVGWVAERLGVSLPRDLEPVIVVLLLGIVTDYCVFFFSGFRLRLRGGETTVAAAKSTAAEYIPIIFTAGLIVAAGSAALLVATLGFLRAFGPGLALTVLISLLVSITLVPALLAILGRFLFWPRASRVVAATAQEAAEAEASRTGTKAVRLLTARVVAAPVAVLCIGILLAASVGLARTDLGFTLINGLPASSEVSRAAHAAATGFADGVLSPTLVVLQAEGLDEREEELADLQRRVAVQPGVAGVVGPASAPTSVPPGVFVSADGGAARLAVILEDDPLGGDAIEDLRRLQARLPGMVRDAGVDDAVVSLAGDTALAAEAVSQTFRDLARVAVAALLIDLLLLIVFLRAIVAPVYLLLASVLALAAALGLTTLLFQVVLGHGELTYYIPFAASVLLVSLGSDYNVFVVGRIWNEAKVRPLRDAITTAAPQASRAIAVAGLALALSFAVLAIVPLSQFREFAFAMFAGVLLDSFLVRSLLVPTLIALFGRKSWWPAKPKDPPPVPAPTA